MAKDSEPSPISWQWWNYEYERPGRWSKVHYLAGPYLTLCGLKVPKAGDVADFDGDTFGEGTCQRCRKAA